MSPSSIQRDSGEVLLLGSLGLSDRQLKPLDMAFRTIFEGFWKRKAFEESSRHLKTDPEALGILALRAFHVPYDHGDRGEHDLTRRRGLRSSFSANLGYI